MSCIYTEDVPPTNLSRKLLHSALIEVLLLKKPGKELGALAVSLTPSLSLLLRQLLPLHLSRLVPIPSPLLIPFIPPSLQYSPLPLPPCCFPPSFLLLYLLFTSFAPAVVSSVPFATSFSVLNHYAPSSIPSTSNTAPFPCLTAKRPFPPFPSKAY